MAHLPDEIIGGFIAEPRLQYITDAEALVLSSEEAPRALQLSPESHEELYAQLLLLFKIEATDNSVSDLSRGNYLCYDPDVWVNKDCKPYHFVHAPSYIPKFQKTIAKKIGTAPDDMRTLKVMLSMRDSIIDGSGNDSYLVPVCFMETADEHRQMNQQCVLPDEYKTMQEQVSEKVETAFANDSEQMGEQEKQQLQAYLQEEIATNVPGDDRHSSRVRVLINKMFNDLALTL